MKLIVLAGLVIVQSVFAMDRFAALSMIESGDDDLACGQSGEVSRFQIRREVWGQLTNAPVSLASDPKVAEVVARKLAAARCEEFAREHGRPATDQEFYILWNAPAQIGHPGRSVQERADRFANLVAQKESSK
jgi:hypothetical protein